MQRKFLRKRRKSSEDDVGRSDLPLHCQPRVATGDLCILIYAPSPQQSGWGAAAAAVGAEKARLSAEQTGGQSFCLLPCGEKKEQEKKGFPSRDPSLQKQILAGKSKSCPLTRDSAVLVWSRSEKTEQGKRVKIYTYTHMQAYLCVYILK